MKGTKRGATAAAAALLILAAACGGEGGDGAGDGPVVRDSAGVAIVVNRGPTWEAGEAWLVDAEPVLEVGTLDGPAETQFARLVGTALRSDGVVLVADAGNARISAFGSDGAFLWSQGRDGEGPGEYVQISALLALAGDSALVYDARTRRSTVLAPDGSLERTYLPTPPEGSFMSAPLGEVAPGILASSGGAFFGDDTPLTDGSAVRRPTRYLLTGPEGESGDTLPALPGREMWLIADGQSISIWSLPFAREAVVAAGAGVVAMGVTERPEWQVRDASGALVRVVRLDLPERPVTAEDWDRARESQIPEDADAARRAALRDVYDAVPRSEVWPVFSDLKVGDRGHLWVQRYAAPWEEAAPRRWWIFDPQGVLLGEVAFPVGFELDAVRGDRVVGRWEDELGVGRVRVYRIVGR